MKGYIDMEPNNFSPPIFYWERVGPSAAAFSIDSMQPLSYDWKFVFNDPEDDIDNVPRTIPEWHLEYMFADEQELNEDPIDIREFLNT